MSAIVIIILLGFIIIIFLKFITDSSGWSIRVTIRSDIYTLTSIITVSVYNILIPNIGSLNRDKYLNLCDV